MKAAPLGYNRVRVFVLSLFWKGIVVNQCHFIGRLCNDPETQELNNGSKKTSFRLAVDGKPYLKDGEKVKDTTFVDCQAWAGGGEVIAKYFTKGQKIAITATLRQDNWTDKKTEEKRSKLYLRVNEFDFVDSKRDDDAEKPAKPAKKAKKDESEAEIPF